MIKKIDKIIQKAIIEIINEIGRNLNILREVIYFIVTVITSIQKLMKSTKAKSLNKIKKHYCKVRQRKKLKFYEKNLQVQIKYKN